MSIGNSRVWVGGIKLRFNRVIMSTLCIVGFVPLFGQPAVDNTWSGTISITRSADSTTVSPSTSLSKETLRKVLRDEITIVLGGNAASGHVSYSLRESVRSHTDYDWHVDDGTSEAVTTATGTDSQETSVKIYVSEDGSYEIKYSTPPVNGTWQRDQTMTIACKVPPPGCSPSSNSTHQSAEQIGLSGARGVIEGTIARGACPNVLAGEEVDSDAEYLTTTRWNLMRAEDVTLIVQSKEYNSWKPEPGADENSPGPHPLFVGFKLSGPGGRPPLCKVVSFELELLNTSREPGIALNMPLAPAAVSGPDLRLVAGSVPPGGEGQTASVPSPDGLTGSAAIAAYDGGGWSTLKVTAVLKSGQRIIGHLETPDGPSEILLPKRAKDSKIASLWLAANGNPRDDADDETTPDNANAGDGLSAYEEYRGLVVKGKYKRLDPRQKELLIEVEEGFAARAQAGLDLFEKASGIKVLALAPGELAQDRVVNRNAGNAHLLSQHALRLVKGSLPAGEAGENQPQTQKGKTPKDSQRVVIDIAQIEEHVRAQAAAAAAARVTMPYTLGDYLAVTIAHEIAHGVGVDHHGPSSNLPKRTIEVYQTGFQIYGSDKTVILTRPWPIDVVGSQGCESSGDLGCLMAYTDMYQWAYASEGGLNVYRKLPILPLGNRFCTSERGTGINDTNPGPSYFGNATWGNCAAKLRVRD